MSSPLICLGCGGVVDEGQGIPPGEAACTCPPPSVEARLVTCPSCGGSLRVGARACPYCRSTLATTRCPSCFAWNLAQARHCQACGQAMDAEGGAGVRQDLACPRCSGALFARHYQDLDVDECDACGGFMLSPNAIDRIVAAKDNATDLRLALPAHPRVVETAVHYVRCPVCSETMNRKAFGRISGVVVDVCAEHGVWFDAGELAAVLAFVARGGLTRAREREQAELERAARALRSERAVGLGQAGAGEPLGIDFAHALAGLWS